MKELDVKKLSLSIVDSNKHFPTIVEKAFEKGYERGTLEGLYKAQMILQQSDVGEYHLLDSVIKEYEDRNYK